MKQYLEMVEDVLTNGRETDDRTGVGTIEVFGRIKEYDLRDGFPLVTVKKTLFDSMIKELLWFLRGETNKNTLGCGIWDAWADEDGELGPVYGKQWRQWVDQWGRTHDQVANAIHALKNSPNSRRIIIQAWNAGELDKMASASCHVMYQFNAIPLSFEERMDLAGHPAFDSSQDGDPVAQLDSLGTPRHYLDCMMSQRSNDLGLGVPFNIASTALLTHLFAREVNMVPRKVVHSMGSLHIYKTHIEKMKKLLDRTPQQLPSIRIADKPIPYPGCPRDGSVLEPDDIQVIGYNSYGFMKLEIAV